MKKKLIFSIIFLFISGFIVHYGDDYLGSKGILRYLFPQEESIIEHSKLYSTGMIFLLIQSFLCLTAFSKKFIFAHCISLFIMLTLSIIVFLIIGKVTNEHSFTRTLVVYGLILTISQFIAYRIIKSKRVINNIVIKIFFLTAIMTAFTIFYTDYPL